MVIMQSQLPQLQLQQVVTNGDERRGSGAACGRGERAAAAAAAEALLQQAQLPPTIPATNLDGQDKLSPHIRGKWCYGSTKPRTTPTPNSNPTDCQGVVGASGYKRVAQLPPHALVAQIDEAGGR